MAAKSGAGASVSSGAGYQAQIGAYLIVCGLCALKTELVDGDALKAVSFETTEAVDDINAHLMNGAGLYIQAKAKIDYSVAKDSQLRSVFKQFMLQCRSGISGIDRLILATTARSSKKIIYDLRSALDAFRGDDEIRFNKDQPAALITIINELLSLVAELREESGEPAKPELAKALLQRAHVHVLDLENNDALGQSMYLVLHSQNFAAPAAVWGKIVADCVSYSKARLTITTTQARSNYDRFRVAKGELPSQPAGELIKIKFLDMNFPVGREVVLGRLLSDALDVPAGLAIMEFYRFDDQCVERIRFLDGKCILQNGFEINLVRRCATYAGMKRIIDADPNLVGDEKVVFIPINSDEDFETGLCAVTHQARLKTAALENQNPLQCIHCGSPVSELSASLVESTQDSQLIVGLSHARCLRAEDRIIGSVQCKFFEEHDDLVNFDVNGWFRAAHGGQMTFANASYIGSEQIVMLWGGRKTHANPGKFVVEMLLRDGCSEIVTVRNGVHRFQKPEADAFVVQLNGWINAQRSTDPPCYSDQSKSFGLKSLLLQKIGGRERLIPVEKAQTRPYERRFEARYSRPGSWYAPLLFIRSLETGMPIRILGIVALLTDPLAFKNYLENWKEAGFLAESYETASLLTDADVDDFMTDMQERGYSVVINPLFASDTSTRLAAGMPFRSVKTIADDGEGFSER